MKEDIKDIVNEMIMGAVNDHFSAFYSDAKDTLDELLHMRDHFEGQLDRLDSLIDALYNRMDHIDNRLKALEDEAAHIKYTLQNLVDALGE